MPPAEGQRVCPTCGASFAPPTSRCPTDGTNLVRAGTPVDPLLGTELDGRYTIRDRLAAGGMGTVYRALQHSVGREVAIKVIQRGKTDEVSVKRFMREAKLAASLSQPNIVAVVDFGQAPDGMLFLVMELCAGRTLHDVIRAEGPFPADRVAHIALQLCDALEAAHGKQIVHRDLKPANVIVLDEPAGRDLIKVLDFGLARSVTGDDEHGSLTSSGVMVGTPHYASPEEILGSTVDARADLYALGAVMYEMANRAPPFSKEGGALAVYGRQTRGEILSFAHPAPATLERLIRRLLERSPAARPKSAADVRTMLLEYQSAPESALSLDVLSVAGPTQRKPWMLALGIAALVLIGVGTSWFVSNRMPAVGPKAVEVPTAVVPVNRPPEPPPPAADPLVVKPAPVRPTSPLPARNPDLVRELEPAPTK